VLLVLQYEGQGGTERKVPKTKLGRSLDALMVSAHLSLSTSELDLSTFFAKKLGRTGML